MKDIYVTAIVLSAGQGKRMNSPVSKQYIEVNGKPILAYTLEAFQKAKSVNEIIVVAQKDHFHFIQEKIKSPYQINKMKKIVEGGKERQDSVLNGLQSILKKTNIVLIHDGARPLILESEIDRIVRETLVHSACIYGVKVKDTIKEVNRQLEVISTPNRDVLYAVQTPQAFDKELIIEAYTKGSSSEKKFTDDSMLVEEYTSTKVKVIEGSYRNVKITTPDDLAIFQELISVR